MESSPWQSLEAQGTQQPPSSWSLGLLGPPFLAQEPLPLVWTTSLLEEELPPEEGLAQGQGLGVGAGAQDRQVWETGIGALSIAALVPPPGIMVHTSLPRSPKFCGGKGGLRRQGLCPCLLLCSVLPACAWNLAGKENIPSLPHSLSLPAVKFEKKPLCL